MEWPSRSPPPADGIDPRVLRVRPQGLGHGRAGAEVVDKSRKRRRDSGGNGGRRSDLRVQQGAARGGEGVEIGRQAAVVDLVVRQQRRLNVACQRAQVADFRDHVAPQLALDVKRVSHLTRASGRGFSVVIGDIGVAVGDRGIDVRHRRPVGRATLPR